MIQREIRHPPGSFPNCIACGREPKHIEGHGSHSREAFDIRHPTGERHQLECRCGVRTAWCPSLALAINQWRLHFAIAQMAAPARPLLRLHK